ncbi:hypothetical protein GWI33_019571, partial [Rhynchophorus ferrugineus]
EPERVPPEPNGVAWDVTHSLNAVNLITPRDAQRERRRGGGDAGRDASQIFMIGSGKRWRRRGAGGKGDDGWMKAGGR